MRLFFKPQYAELQLFLSPMATASLKLLPFFSRCRFWSLRFSSTPQNWDLATIRNVPKLNPTALIDLLDSEPDPVSAARLFRWASRQRNFRQTPATYAHLVCKLGMAGKSQDMEEFLKEMVRFHYPDAESSFQSLIESFCRNRRPREALKVFEIANSSKFRLSISACNALLRAVVEERLNLEEVVFVYKEMVKAGILPNVDTLNCLIKGLVENSMMELALDQFEKMEEKECRPNSQTFEVLIGGLCLNGKADEAVRIWNRMLETGCTRDCGFYMSVVPWFCRISRLDEAARLFKLMKNDGFLPDLYLHSILIHHLCENLRLNDAIEVFEEMGASGFIPVTCMHVDIVNAYCRLGEFSEAVRFLEENDISDIEPYNALLQGLFDGRRVQEAMAYLKKIQEMGMIDGHSWNILISYLCRKGHMQKVVEVLSRMIVSSSFPDETTYSFIMSGYWKVCLYDSAMDWFGRGLLKNMLFDSKSCSELIMGLCHMGSVNEAVEVFYCISGKGCVLNQDALDILIRGLCLRGMVNEAIKVRSIASCNGTPSTSFTYEIIFLALLDLNKENSTLPLLSQMLEEGCTLNSKTYCILIHGLCVESTGPNAALLFNQMIQDGFIPDTETLERLVYSSSKRSQLHLVLHSLDKVVKDGWLTSPMVCNMIIYGLLKEGCKNEAHRLLDWMLEKGWVPDTNTHGLLVGSDDVEDRYNADEVYEDGDGVSSILSEGLSGSG